MYIEQKTGSIVSNSSFRVPTSLGLSLGCALSRCLPVLKPLSDEEYHLRVYFANFYRLIKEIRETPLVVVMHPSRDELEGAQDRVGAVLRVLAVRRVGLPRVD